MRVLGLMSGTSADGVDAVLVELSGSAEHPRWTLLRSASLDYPASIRQRILAVGQGEANTAASSPAADAMEVDGPAIQVLKIPKTS